MPLAFKIRRFGEEEKLKYYKKHFSMAGLAKMIKQEYEPKKLEEPNPTPSSRYGYI